MTVKVVTDSTADLPPEVYEEFDISTVPIYINMRGKTYRDAVDISREEVYAFMASGVGLATTSQPSPADFSHLYLELSRKSTEIVSIHLGSKLSGTYAAALTARDMVNGKCRVEVVDSSLVSGALGLVVIRAARLAKAGADMATVLANIREVISRISAYGLLESFRYILRSGRLKVAGNLLGNVLNVKPFLKMRDGAIHLGGILRTKTQGVDKLFKMIDGVPNLQEIAISHSAAPDEIQKVKERFSALVEQGHLYIAQLAPALGVHGGPGSMVVAAYGGP